MKKKLTLKQIARELDVSVSTVSKALRNSQEISKDTREKVQAYAKLYNYRPNNIALSLKNRRTKNIGVIIPEIVHYFFTTVITGIERTANARGYNVIVCLSNESFDREVVNMQMLANGSIDGFIMSLSKETQEKQDFVHLREVIDQGMPLVMFDRVAEDVHCDKVVIDDVESSYTAVSHLLAGGAKRVALISTADYLSVGKLRTLGYEKALQDAGLEVDPDLILKIEDVEHCETTIATLFSDQQFDAVFAVNELFAVTAMKIAQRQGYKIPDDIAFIAFTDGILSKYASPTLSTIAQHGIEMGAAAAKLLIDKLEEKVPEDVYFTQVIQSSLIERESTHKAEG